MIRSKVSIERQINDRLYQFVCPHEASMVECLTMCEDIRNYLASRVQEIEKEAQKVQDQAKE